ncbi:hypothetical protein [Streptomyces antimycoticus]|uniref:hypothetical protein n=1 Tax=Streptomyces antimycoticus TaxID=68175 RepID=UPI0036ED337E|nr:hypothetical protein OG751_04210 [Streptomyces antimycoticus]
MTATPPPEYARLAETVRARRLELEMPIARAAATAVVSKDTWKRIEEGKPVRELTYAKMENVLGWAAGSISEILDGATQAVTAERGAAVAQARAGGLGEEDLTQALAGAMVAATDTLTAAEIRDITEKVVHELKRRGLIQP